MKKNITILFFSLVISTSYGQYFIDKEGLNHYEIGSMFLKQGDFYNADSVLSLALCSFRNENVYFNRGISRIMQGDTAGFCSDLEIAAFKYFDPVSSKTYNEICCKKVDTVYYNKKYLRLKEGEKYKYTEVIRYHKYKPLTTGIIHNIKAKEVVFIFDYGCEDHLIGINDRKTDIIAKYEIVDNAKYYHMCPHPSNVNIRLHDKYFKKNANKVLVEKYSNLKIDNDIDELMIGVEITISKAGYISDLEIVGTFPEIKLDELKTNIENDLIDVIRSWNRRFIPAKFKGEKVNSVTFQIIEY